VRERLARRRGDASDADFAVYERARESWEAASEESRRALVDLDTERGAGDAVERALAALRARGLAD
jgi:predicted kinase